MSDDGGIINIDVLLPSETSSDISSDKEFLEDLYLAMNQKYLAEGIQSLQALWVLHRFSAWNITYAGVPFVLDLYNIIFMGNVSLLYSAINLAVPDDMTQPQHWLSANRLASIKESLAQYLGI